MLAQLHWQNPSNPGQTEFVAQAEFGNADGVHAWARELCERRGGEMPAGWMPMVCTEDSPHFAWQPATAEVGG